MKDRPILFSGAMVRAILDGRKTQTRRAIKNVPSWMHFGRDIMDWDLSGIHQCEGEFEGTDQWCLDVQTDVDDYSRKVIRCPYGQPGDRLWVRETFMIEPHPSEVGITREMIPRTWDAAVDAAGTIHYAADPGAEIRADGRRWKPSIHMPRSACRLELEITGVRVERLQAISEGDAMAEGAEPVLVPPDGGSCPHIEGFRELWASTGGDWDANPWVWVVSFKQAQP